MARPFALIVEDNFSMAKLLQVCLLDNGFVVAIARDAAMAIQSIRQKPPDIIVLDWMLPGVDGDKLLKQLRAQESTKHIPIMMLTAKDEEECKVDALDNGADDYMTKPFSTREFCARIRSILRRTRPQALLENIEWGGIVLKPRERQAWVGKEEMNMAAGEFNLLHFLMLHPEQVFSRGQILNNVWGTNAFVEERTVDVQMGRLRKALKPHKVHFAIETVRGFGYRIKRMP